MVSPVMTGRTNKLLLAGAAMVLASCARPRPPIIVQHASIIVESDPAVPLAEASVIVDGEPVTATELNGQAALTVRGVAGDRHRVEVHCPEGHLAASPPANDLFVRKPERGLVDPAFVVRCEPATRTATIHVHLDGGSGLPLTRLGHVVGRTDAKGEAEITVVAEPGEELEVVADTSLTKDLHPQNPSLTFTMGNQDQTFAFAQKLTLSTKKAPPPKRAPKPTGPVRLAQKSA